VDEVEEFFIQKQLKGQQTKDEWEDQSIAAQSFKSSEEETPNYN
jgi:hypothetical protein